MLKINAEEIVRMTLENGGHTVDVGGRYMVAEEGYEVIVPVKKFRPSDLVKYLGIMPKMSNATLGTWLHENNVYIDTSKAYDTVEQAMQVARANNQLAIFDTKTLTEISVD